MKTVIEMARDQGLPETEVAGVFIVNQDDLERFANLVRADEREQIAQQNSTCSNALRIQGKAYPRTCKKCGLGPCVELAQQALDKKAENARELRLDYEPAQQEPLQNNPFDCGVYLGSGKDYAIKHHVSYGPAQQEPAGWRPATFHRDNLSFNPGFPDEQTVKFWKMQGVEIEYCYTSPLLLSPGATLYTSPPAQQEPVAYMSHNKENFVSADDVGNSVPNWTDYYPTPLYTTPPPCPTCEALARTVMLDQTSHDQFKPDWDTQAVLVEEQQRMAKRILELEALLERQTTRIVDLQTHTANLEGEE